MGNIIAEEFNCELSCILVSSPAHVVCNIRSSIALHDTPQLNNNQDCIDLFEKCLKNLSGHKNREDYLFSLIIFNN